MARKFSPAELAQFTDKDSKKDVYRSLYEEKPFLEAYAAHTDLRIETDGPELAIGAKKDGSQDWHIHGPQQLDFLRHMGMEPHHRLLDFGCGTGRLAFQAMQYLDIGNYIGTDISEGCINESWDMVKREGLEERKPTFLHSNGLTMLEPGTRIDYIWAHSVFTHLPPDVIEEVIADIATLRFGQFFFTFKWRDEGSHRSGLKQFQYHPSFFEQVAKDFGLKAQFLETYEWPAGQKTMRISQ